MRSSLAAILVLFAVSQADAYEFRVRFVERVATVDVPLSWDSIDAGNGLRHRVRLQIGVFDDPVSAAPLGGVIGWNLGSIVVHGDPYNSDETRTPGRLAPFNASTDPNANGNPPLPGGDPFETLTDIDATRGMETLAWGCDPLGAPLPQPAPVVRGRNAYVSVFEFSLDPTALAFDYHITFSGNLLAATEWRTVGAPLPPDCGDPGNPNDDIPGSVSYLPTLTQPVEFTRHLNVLGFPTPGSAVFMGIGLLMGCRRRRDARAASTM